MIDISFIIVNWNTKDLLRQCIESLIEQSDHYRSEIIVVDNGSTDGSVQIVENCYREIRLIRNGENLGFSKANNIGIRESNGRYVCIVNSDIKVLYGIDSMLDFMEQHPDIGVLGPRTLNSDLSLRHNCRKFPNLWNTLCLALSLHKIWPKSSMFSGTLMTYFPHDEIKNVDVLPGCFLMLRREALEQVGLLDERFFIYGEDKDWCRRFWKSSWKVVFFPLAEVIHFAKASSSKAPSRFAKEKQKANYQYWQKHHRWLSLKIFLSIMIFHHSIRFIILLFVYLIRHGERKIISMRIASSAACALWSLNHFVLGKFSIHNKPRKSNAY